LYKKPDPNAGGMYHYLCMMAQSRTGTGKTAAFGLALLARVDPRLQALQAIVLSPTREVAIQTTRKLQDYAGETGIIVGAAVKYTTIQLPGRKTTTSCQSWITGKKCASGTPPSMWCRGCGGEDGEHMCYACFQTMHPNDRVASEHDDKYKKRPDLHPAGPHVLSCTIGQFKGLVDRKQIDMTHLKVLVLDEADQMIAQGQDRGSYNDILAIHSSFPATLKASLQVLLFSATFNPTDVQNAAVLIAGREYDEELLPANENKFLPNIAQFALDTNQFAGRGADKQSVLNTLFQVLARTINDKTIIFFNDFRTANQSMLELKKCLEKQSQLVGVCYGNDDMSVEKRQRVLNEFETGDIRVLLCTDVLARGIDVSGVVYVVNFDLPGLWQGPGRPRKFNSDLYLHRIGRCGRFGEVGFAISFTSTPQEQIDVAALANHRGVTLSELQLLPFGADISAQVERVNKQLKDQRVVLNAKVVDQRREGAAQAQAQAAALAAAANPSGAAQP
jgi:superfamily II DNA/RNA helicase